MNNSKKVLDKKTNMIAQNKVFESIIRKYQDSRGPKT